MLSSTTHDDLCILLAGAATADKTAIEYVLFVLCCC